MKIEKSLTAYRDFALKQGTLRFTLFSQISNFSRATGNSRFENVIFFYFLGFFSLPATMSRERCKLPSTADDGSIMWRSGLKRIY